MLTIAREVKLAAAYTRWSLLLGPRGGFAVTPHDTMSVDLEGWPGRAAGVATSCDRASTDDEDSQAETARLFVRRVCGGCW